MPLGYSRGRLRTSGFLGWKEEAFGSRLEEDGLRRRTLAGSGGGRRIGEGERPGRIAKKTKAGGEKDEGEARRAGPGRGGRWRRSCRGPRIRRGPGGRHRRA